MNAFLLPKRPAYAAFIAAIVLVLTCSLTSCHKEDTTTPVNTASARDKMVGNYLVKSNGCADAPLMTGDAFPVNAGAGPTELSLGNVFVATVSGSNFTIAETTIGGITQSGRGSFGGGLMTINLDLQATATTPAGTCTIELQKQ